MFEMLKNRLHCTRPLLVIVLFVYLIGMTPADVCNILTDSVFDATKKNFAALQYAALYHSINQSINISINQSKCLFVQC